MEKKQAYEKPVLRKVRLDVKTSVLSACNSSTNATPDATPFGGKTCKTSGCMTPPPPV